jgi:CRP-like cAMP-binding protein
MRRVSKLDKKAILGGHFLLRHLSDSELDDVVRYARVQRHAKGEMIFRKWTPGTGMMAVASGRVKICSVSMDGKEFVLDFVNPGEIFGEIALLDGEDRTADATALEDTEVVVLERRDFMPFLERHPRTCIKLLGILCGRLRHTNELIEDTLFLNVAGRLAKRLIRFARMYGKQLPDGILIPLKLSQREIAALIGVTRESINKQLRAWQEERCIRVDRGVITITDMRALEDLAEQGY